MPRVVELERSARVLEEFLGALLKITKPRLGLTISETQLAFIKENQPRINAVNEYAHTGVVGVLDAEQHRIAAGFINRIDAVCNTINYMVEHNGAKPPGLGSSGGSSGGGRKRTHRRKQVSRRKQTRRNRA